MEEEHQAAAEEDAQAGHQQHGHWGDTASLPEAHAQQAGAAAEPQLTPLTMTTGRPWKQILSQAPREC